MMARLYISLVLCIFTMTTCKIMPATCSMQKTSCGDWMAFGKEKCLHIVDSATFQTKNEAEVVCESLAEIMELDDIPTLVTIRTEKEQEELKKILFEEIGLLEHIWLGLDRGDDGVFRWNNGAEMYFSNLAKQNESAADRPCVQMESGQGVYPMGQWVRVNCRKRNVVVCEKIQVWTTAKLQKKINNLQAQMERETEKQENSVGRMKTSPGKYSTGQHTDFHESPCGNWIPYKNEKCFKIAYHSGGQTKKDADIICSTFADGDNNNNLPKLITVKTKVEQDFLEKYLFEDEGMVDNVWLGLELENDEVFRWNDETELHFTNWQEQMGLTNDEQDIGLLDDENTNTVDDDPQLSLASGRNATIKERNCVQMASGEGAYPMGKWVRANCKASLRVVCEKQQTWSVSALQSMLLNLQLKFDRYQQEAQQAIETLKQNPVPLKFIYVQLPGQEDPTTLWPQVTWKDVSSFYSGLFFRVVGGNAASFGQEQGASASSLDAVEKLYRTHDFDFRDYVNVPYGGWSDYVFSNRDDGRGIHWWGLRFHNSGNEIRPRNKAIKIWQRMS